MFGGTPRRRDKRTLFTTAVTRVKTLEAKCWAENSRALVSIVSFRTKNTLVVSIKTSDAIGVVTEHVQLQVLIPVSENDEELIGSRLDGG